MIGVDFPLHIPRGLRGKVYANAYTLRQVEG